MKKRRIVIKVGSAILSQNGELVQNRIEKLSNFIQELMINDEVILVSSGAVSAGYTILKLDKTKLANKEALASIGQPLLMSIYKENFQKFGINVAQILITEDDLDSMKCINNAKNTINTLLENQVLPIINENDSVAIKELLFGDNDQLSAHVCYHFDADLLVILSDIDGYYDKNPKDFKDAKIRKIVNHIKDEELQLEYNPNNEFATGGIVTKLKAANFLLENNKQMFLANGFDLSDIKEYLLNNNHEKGTLFCKE
jgi:glutamate 5-kinase